MLAIDALYTHPRLKALDLRWAAIHDLYQRTCHQATSLRGSNVLIDGRKTASGHLDPRVVRVRAGHAFQRNFRPQSWREGGVDA